LNAIDDSFPFQTIFVTFCFGRQVSLVIHCQFLIEMAAHTRFLPRCHIGFREFCRVAMSDNLCYVMLG
jgi:hypothetical protein